MTRSSWSALALCAALALSACDAAMTASAPQPSPKPAPSNNVQANNTPDAATDTPVVMPDERLANIAINAPISTLAIGQSTIISAQLTDAQGAQLEVRGLTWTSSDPAVLTVDARGIAHALSEGSAQITASAGQIKSEPLTFNTIPAPSQGPYSLRIDAAPLHLHPLDALRLSAAARNAQGQLVSAEKLTWHVQDANIASISADGVLTAHADGQTTLWVELEGAKSPTLNLTVTSQETYPTIALVTPSADSTTQSTLNISAETKHITPGTTPGFGTPFKADKVEVLLDNAVVAELTPEFGRAQGALDTSTWPKQATTLSLRAHLGEQRFESAQLQVVRHEPDTQTWEDLATLDGEDGALFTFDETPRAITLTCGRECSLYGHVQQPDQRWKSITYQRQEHREASGAIETRLNTSARNIDLPVYVGWGWPSADARQLHVPPNAPALYATWSNKDAFRSFNIDTVPEHYWFDCYVARWDDAAGFDGQGGWRLLSSQDPNYLFDLPHPDTFPKDQQRHPTGIDVVRSEDCSTPRLTFNAQQQPIVGYIGTPVPGDQPKLYMRRWDGQAWQDLAPTFPLNAQAPQLRSLTLDATGQPIAVIQQPEGPNVLRLGMDGQWQDISPTQLGALDSALSISGANLLGASLQQHDLTLSLGTSAGWTPLGGAALDVNPWAHVHEVALLTHNDAMFVAWTEGPSTGNRDLYVAQWSAAQAQWQRIGQGPVELDIDQDATHPSIHLDPQGRLLIRYTTTKPDTGSYIQRIQRTAAPVITL